MKLRSSALVNYINPYATVHSDRWILSAVWLEISQAADFSNGTIPLKPELSCANCIPTVGRLKTRFLRFRIQTYTWKFLNYRSRHIQFTPYMLEVCPGNEINHSVSMRFPLRTVPFFLQSIVNVVIPSSSLLCNYEMSGLFPEWYRSLFHQIRSRKTDVENNESYGSRTCGFGNPVADGGGKFDESRPRGRDQVSAEILGLSKVNWNTFDLYSKLPATLQFSCEIARIGSLQQRFGVSSYDYRLFI